MESASVKWPRRSVWGAASLAVAALVAVGAVMLMHQKTPGEQHALRHISPPVTNVAGGVAPGPGRPLSALFDPAQPLLPGGRSVSGAEAAGLVRHSLYLLQDSGLGTPDVWVVQSIGEDGKPFFDAVARYDSRLVLTYDTWPAGRDPESAYKQEASQWGVGYVTTIVGHPAWVVPAGSKSTTGTVSDDPTISTVNISIGNTEVTLLGRVPVSDLVRYASTLQATAG